ncbi:MAG TPA: hypothetical protein VFD00_13445 [Thermoclostridium sp.]|nr:hypothetical protein [Thermoclostridium sp.]
MAKMGRPTKLNDKVQHEIVTAVKQGNYIETASAYAGINKTTLYDWLRRGRREIARVEKDGRRRIKKSEEKYVNFSHALEKALAESEMRDVLIIGKAGETQWQASAWRLERKFPDKWGRKRNLTELDIEEQKAKIELLKANKDKITGDGANIEDLSEVYKQVYDEE